MLTLKELVDRCLLKDKAAWEEFVLRFKAVVEKSVRARLSRHNFPYTVEDVKDITQNIFLDIWENDSLEKVRDEDKITGWIVIVSQNAAIDFIRRNKKLLRHSEVFIDEEDKEHNKLDALISASNPLEELADKELSQTLDALIDSLEPRDNLVIKLNLLHGLAYKEIAVLLKIPINTVATVIRRSTLKLRESLLKRGYKDF